MEKQMQRLIRSFVLFVLVAMATPLFAAGQKPRLPGPGDKCPVCGMFVAKYSDFVSQLQFRDGAVFFFDGPKDLFKYYLGVVPAMPGRKSADITAVYVTSYYTLVPIDGRTAYYVSGSDVFGPMGRELVAFEKEAEAREFSKDHKGKAILRFKEVTSAAVKGLD
jgi:nitrous oxide reductase accessory protein NosL